MQSFDNKRNKINRRGMIVLTSWAGANVAGSTAAYMLTNSNEEKQFYIMNGAWGVINLGIALPGLLIKPKPASSLYDLQRRQTNTEKLFIANAALDVAYMAGGFYFLEQAKHQTDIVKQERSRGFGNAIIIQGSGLLIFDFAMTLINNRNRKKNLDPFLKNVIFAFSGNSAKIGYRFN